jgi:hypothetical protein
MEVIGTFKIIAAIALIWIAMIGLIILGNRLAETGTRMYNCSIAEISPDFSPAMREECRKLRREQK